MTGFNGHVGEPAVRAMWAARQLPGAGEALRTIYEAMFVDPAAAVRRQGTLPLEALSHLAMPVRVLWGAEDCILPVAQADGLPENIVVERIGGAGHMLPDECAEAVAAAINANLAAAG